MIINMICKEQSHEKTEYHEGAEKFPSSLEFPSCILSLGTAMTEYALIVWVYRQEGTALSITLLTLCSFAPTILFE